MSQPENTSDIQPKTQFEVQSEAQSGPIFANAYKAFGGKTEEWAEHDDPLTYRELGLEYLENGRVRLKAGIETPGDVGTPWSQLPYNVDAGDPDAVTIVKDKDNEDKLTAKDIAIGGDVSDLASGRGQIGPAKQLQGSDYDDLTDDGNYAVASSGTTHAPNGFAQTLLQVNTRIVQDATSAIAQISGDTATPRMARRILRDKATNPAWSDWYEFLMSGRIGDGILVTNGIPSVPEYQGATDEASGVSGLVPAATIGEKDKFLKGDGTWGDAGSGAGSSYILLPEGNTYTNEQIKAMVGALNLPDGALCVVYDTTDDFSGDSSSGNTDTGVIGDDLTTN